MILTPSVYEHAAACIGETPWSVSRNFELLVKAHSKAYTFYHHSPIVVGIDIYNLEAEAYGAEVSRPEGNGIPAITEHICGSAAEVAALPFFDPSRSGRIPMIIEAGIKLKKEFMDADVRVPLSGPFSIAVNLMGFEKLLESIAFDPDGVRNALHHIVRGQYVFAEQVARAGLGIAFFESAAVPPLLSPDQFRKVEFPPLRQIMKQTAEITGQPVPCIIGGDTEPILDEMIRTGTTYLICPAETDQKAFIKKIRKRPDITVRINMKPETISKGTVQEIIHEIDRIADLARTLNNACIGTGAVPYETPKENVITAIKYAEKL